jgi:integrase
MPLSDFRIKSTKPRDKRYQIADSDGLYIEIMPSGKKYWRLRYSENNKRSWHTIGEYPAIGLQEARERRNSLRKRLRDGEAFANAKEKLVCTFEDVALAWADAHEVKINGLKYKKNIRSRLTSHILPFIGTKDIKTLKSTDILPILDRLIALGRLEMACRARSICSQVFRYAIATGKCESDPTYALRGMIISPQTKHLSSITDPREVGRLLRAIDVYPQTVVRCALLFSALTFCRPGEIRHAEWSELDKNEWRIPAEKMKMKRPHIVPLSRQALEMLDKVRPLTGHGQYIFPSNRAPRGDRPMSDATVLVALRSMGYTKEQMTAHGFRSMASTLLNENGFPPDHIERQLAHVEGNSVRAAYNYAEYLPERRKMMQWWADYLDELREDI